MLNLQSMSQQIANPVALTQRLKENHIYLSSQGQSPEGVSTFLFVAKLPKGNDEHVLYEIGIKQGVGIQVKCKCTGEQYFTP